MRSPNTHVREVIVEDVGATVCERDGKLVGRTDEEVIGDGLGNLLLVLIIVICVLVARVLWREKRYRHCALKFMSQGTTNCVRASSQVKYSSGRLNVQKDDGAQKFVVLWWKFLRSA